MSDQSLYELIPLYELSFFVWVIIFSMSFFPLYELFQYIYELFPFVWVISPCMSYFPLYELFPLVWVIFLSTQDAVPGQEVEESDQGGISSDGW